jgi:predicted nucleotidyltransferase
MTNLAVKQEYLDMLIKIFNDYCPNAEIWAYGSRIKNESHDGSDLDLTVKSFGSQDLQISKLRELIIDSNVPFLVDISLFDNLPESFKQEILSNHVVIYS